MPDLELRRIRARKRLRVLLERVLIYALLLLILVISVYPFVWTFVTSLETSGGIFEFPPSLVPENPSLRNYREVFSLVPVARQVLNSLIICVLGVGLSVAFCALAAYPLAKMSFPGRNFIFYAILATLVLPNEAGLIVNYVTTVKLGLLRPETGAVGQFAAIILPALPSTVGLFLLRQAYLAVPLELIEAARIDGAGELTIWRRVMLPLTMPTIAAFSILQFVAIWNSFLWAVIVLRDRELYPLAAGLLDLAGAFATNTRAVSAGAVIQIIPILIIFFVFQRYFMRGLEGAVKG
ncbi:carbohydrate ABC transporter permease [Calidithermus roseus]|uniref:L-arabinose transport system permease protein AraQ n=1 Tax=Calidithermus roseus TaxID=1644118 RepID=A0A399EQ75_9DEIN|nr:carbohydrate ABC transporter permease [Calidithermus roseus]RIH85189.1 L-arabinose transport system permease protein AraQ [Calidithermus roseus]